VSTNDEYYRQQAQDVRTIEGQIQNWPEIIAAMKAVHTPRLKLQCPRGHSLLTVHLVVDHNWRLSVAPVAGDDRPERGSVVAQAAGPLDTGTGHRAAVVCAEPGCPRPVSGTTTCAEHGAYVSDSTSDRTKYICGRCGAEPEVTPARLLQLYALGLRLQRHAIQLLS